LKEDIHPNGTKIYFIESEHKYYTDKVKDFTSVTGFVESLFKKFDKDKISYFYAKKHGLSQEEVLLEWETKAQDGRELGNNIHEFCEAYLLKKDLPEPISEKAKLLFKYAVEKLENLLTNFSLVSSEKMIFSEKLKLCGTADLIMQEKSTNKLYLLDFKTNNTIDKTNKWGKYALPPFSKFDDNNFTHYIIQLNAYRKLLLAEKYYNEEIYMGIIHFSKYGTSSYKVKNIQNDIDLMFQYFFNN
jgi:ATP-dependent exoDNAse (exonuclease V) beta subunit